MALAMAENGIGLKEKVGEEHEEGEISDEEPPPHAPESKEQLESLLHVEADEAVAPAAVVAAPVSALPQSSERDPPQPLMSKQVGLDEMVEQGSGNGEQKNAYAQQNRKRDAYAGRLELDVVKEDDRGNSRKRSDWGVYGSNLYNFAWAQAVSGRPSGFATAGDSPSISPSSKVSIEGLSSSGSGNLGSWSSTESHKKLSREYSRDLESYGRSVGRSLEERDDMSPLRENGSRTLERVPSERDATNRGRRIIRETSWSGRTERFVTVKSRNEKRDRGGGVAENGDYRRGHVDGVEEGRWRKQRSRSGSPVERLDEVEESKRRSPSEATVQLGQNAGDNDENEEREEGELEEGEIELPDQQKPDSPPSTKEPPNATRQQNKYSGGTKTGDYWPKDKNYVRSLSSKSQQSRPQIDDYSSRNRHRQPKPQESHREKNLTLAGELVKNVTVKDAQKSFVDVCGRLCKSLRVLDELQAPPTSRQAGGLQDGQLSLPREITSLARQAFAGIRAVYAVRNTASGREQERDKNIFPRLLELANGVCQKLFTPKQTRELEVMMQTIANAGRLVRDGTEKGQYPREHQLSASNKKSNENNDAKADSSLGSNNIGSVNISASMETKGSSEISVAGRLLGVVDAKQAEEAAAIAAAALAYAQSSAAARANSSFGSTFDIRSSGTSVQGVGPWGFPSQVQQFNVDPRVNPLQPNNSLYHNLSTGNKYQPQWNSTEQQRSIKLGHDGYSGPFVVEPKGHETSVPNSALLQGTTKGNSNPPPGYSKSPATSVGMLEAEWEQLSPPGAGKSSYGRLSAAQGLQAIGVQKDSTAQGIVWSSSREMGMVPAYQNSRGGAAPLYPPEHLLNLNQQRNMYSSERLPSPTPDEDDNNPSDVSVLPSLPPLEIKPNALDVASKEPSILTQPPPSVGNVPMPIMLPGSIHNLIRSQSLDGSGPVIDPGIMQKGNSGDLSLLAATRAVDHSESMKTLNTIPLPGNFRSRDPRRRLQNSSVDLTDMGATDLSSQVMPGPNLSLGEATHLAGLDRNKKRLGSDLDDKLDSKMLKRAKLQSDSNVDINGFTMDSLNAASGTGGWLDDNHVLSFTSAEELPVAMDVDEDGPFTPLDPRNGMGSDGLVNSERQLDLFPDFGNNMTMNKKQKVDPGQQVGESVQRKMKSRDPRRVFLETHVERGDSSLSVDTVKADGMVSLDPRRADFSLAVKATAEAPGGNDKEKVQASKQGASLAPNFTAGMAGSSSLQMVKSEQPVYLDSGPGVSSPVTDDSVIDGSLEVEAICVSSESISQEFPEQQKEKPTAANAGLRKPKGSPSQWGASQVHPHLEQLLGDLSEEDRRSVQLERQRRMEEQDRMFSAGKLCLVLDLDHTLLNSAKFSEIEPEWDQRLRVAESAERNRTARDGVERRELYRFPHMSMWTKLRPGIWKFLARASQLYELHVYTMGNKVYATEMAKLLDPTGKLFAGRVISKGDDGDGDDLLPKSKDLDGVLGMESAVVIIDDSARVWPHHSENLIVVERYMYFPCSRRQFGLAGPSLLEVGHDERESDGMLASALGVIDRIHQSFFNHPKLREVDVREILAAQQRSVLAGCKVVFSRVFPVGEAEPHRHPLWRTAEQFGAICTITIDDQVTHVVAISLGTDKVNWALETGRYVVRPAWLEASTILYRRANEREFPVIPQ